MVAHLSRFKYESEQRQISYGLTIMNQWLATSRTVEELLFEGYDDRILTIFSSLPESMTGGVKVADKFGWFYQVCRRPYRKSPRKMYLLLNVSSIYDRAYNFSEKRLEKH